MAKPMLSDTQWTKLACAQAVAADGLVAAREAELLRAIADTLDCPVPPFVEAMQNEELTSATQRPAPALEASTPDGDRDLGLP